MGREAAERHRPVMRLPRQLVLGKPLEQAARGAHLMVVVREQRVFDRHQQSLPKTRRGVRTQGARTQGARHRDRISHRDTRHREKGLFSLCLGVCVAILALCALCRHRMPPDICPAAAASDAASLRRSRRRRADRAGPRRPRHLGRPAHLRRRTTAICFSRRGSCRRRIGCFRWICGADRRKGGCRRCWARISSSAMR